MRVTVLGPNGINDATFHVHAAGCRDIGHRKYLHALSERPWSVDVDTERELIETLFGDFIGTGETSYTNADGVEVFTTWEDYRGETRIFPCVTFERTGR